MKYISKEKDCFGLHRRLKAELIDKVSFFTAPYSDRPTGTYISSYRRSNGEGLEYGGCLPFYCKYSGEEFLQISVGKNHDNTELVEQIAALSDFYEAVRDEVGEPTAFYSVAEEGFITLYWAFADKEAEMLRLQNGEADTVIIFGEEPNEISKKLGIPTDLIKLVDGSISEYIMYKRGGDAKSYNIKDGIIPLRSKQKEIGEK